MAKVTYLDPIDHLSGKISKQTRTIYVHRSAATSNPGTPNFTQIRGNRTTAVSQTERDYRIRFGSICTAARQRLNDASKMAADQAAFRAQTQYRTLYQYVWHQVAATIE